MSKMHCLSERFLCCLIPSKPAAITLVALLVALWGTPTFCGEIHDAAKGGKFEKVKAMIEGEPDLVFSKDDDGSTPLHFAAANGRINIVEFLIANKADVNAKDDNGSTPLHHAVFGGYKDVVELLLIHGADANVKNNQGYTPLDFVALWGHKDLKALFDQYSAKDTMTTGIASTNKGPEQNPAAFLNRKDNANAPPSVPSSTPGSKHPSAPVVEEHRNPEDLLWDKITKNPSIAAMREYAALYPNTKQAQDVPQIIADEQIILDIKKKGVGKRHVVPEKAWPGFVTAGGRKNSEIGRSVFNCSEEDNPCVVSTVFGHVLYTMPKTITDMRNILQGPFFPCGDSSVFVVAGRVENVQGDANDPLRLVYLKKFGLVHIGGKGTVTDKAGNIVFKAQ